MSSGACWVDVVVIIISIVSSTRNIRNKRNSGIIIIIIISFIIIIIMITIYSNNIVRDAFYQRPPSSRQTSQCHSNSHACVAKSLLELMTCRKFALIQIVARCCLQNGNANKLHTCRFTKGAGERSNAII